MNFTFGVLTFNSSKYVIETLESIKYQIEQYGREWNCDLIVSDDFSGDNTVILIQKWIENNRMLFCYADILEAKKNNGTVINYQKLYDSVRTEYFHIIAGDDLFSSNNIFEYIKKLKQYEVVTTIPISLDEKGLFIEYSRLYRFIGNMKKKNWTSKQLVHSEMYGSFVHTPSTIFRKEMYDETIQKYVGKFDLFEDDPKWFRLFEKTKSILFEIYPIVLYRYHDESVCHIPNKRFRKDMLRLYADYISVCKSWRMKFFLNSKYKTCKNCRKISFANFCRFLEGRIALVKVLINKSDYDKIKKVEQICANESLYYQGIVDKSNKFIIAFKQ